MFKTYVEELLGKGKDGLSRSSNLVVVSGILLGLQNLDELSDSDLVMLLVQVTDLFELIQSVVGVVDRQVVQHFNQMVIDVNIIVLL